MNRITRPDLLAVLDQQEGFSGIPEKTPVVILLMILRTLNMGDLAKMSDAHANLIIDWFKENR